MNPTLELENELQSLETKLSQIKELVDKESSDEMRDLYEDELAQLQLQIGYLKQSIKTIAGDFSDSGEDTDSATEVSPNEVILEVRSGTGGDEAAIFAGDLLNMYSRWVEKKKFKKEVLNFSEGNAGGVKLASLEIKGLGVYDLLKNESGVHRVQRVPATESAGRIHTSTATVAILPKLKKVEIVIRPEDVKMDFFRSGGAGGQNVNKVSTAVRLTHLPSGVVVECQEERSQMKNREKAMEMLKSRLYNEMQAQRVQSITDLRASQVGAGERSEKIRTYNFPQDRITDHRIQKSWGNISAVMNGDLDGILEEVSSINSLEMTSHEDL